MLGSLCMGLNSCAILPGQSTSSAAQPGQSAPPQGAAASSAATGSSVQEITSVDPQEQQRLIAEINRDGAVTNLPRFSEAVPAAVAPQGDDVVELNYEQVDLRLILEELADALDITMVIDPSIDRRVSIRTSANRPLQRADIWPLVRMLSRDNGITLEQVGDVYNARNTVSRLPVEITTPGSNDQTSASVILQVTPLVYVSSNSAIELLAPLVDDGSITRLTNSNVLAISGSASQLERINQLLQLIDSDPFNSQGIQLLPLNNASATEVAEELSEILIQIEGNNPSYQVKAIARINSLLVTAPATRGFEEIQRWVRILDADSQEQVEQLFHYRVKNLKAVELAETLTSVFEDDRDRQGDNAQDQQTPRLPLATAADGTAMPVVEPTAQNTVNSSVVSANLQVKIVADESTNSLLIRGTARDYRQLLTTINQLDTVPLQVMVNAVIALVTLTEDTRFGVDWSRVAANASLDNLSTSTVTNFLPASSLGGLLFSKSFVDGAARVEATLEAIALNNEVTLLARPSLTVSNNQEGEIQIGAEVPVQQGESISTGGIATTNIQYRPTGIELYITPQINADGIVNLTIRQVLSSVDSSASGVNNNPVFNNQEISTTVVVRNTENVVLGGLIQTDNETLNTGIPGLNRIPVLGRLFSYQQVLQERKELFIVIRPEIIDLNNQTTLQYSDILARFTLAADLLADDEL